MPAIDQRSFQADLWLLSWNLTEINKSNDSYS